jgi:iron complex outermembrane receptor protein
MLWVVLWVVLLQLVLFPQRRNRMRRLVSFILLALVPTIIIPPLHAQDGRPSAVVERGPRFLLATSPHSPPVRLDASRTSVLRQHLSLDLDGVTLETALATIAREAGLKLVYSKAIVPLDRRVELTAERITVAAALTEVLLDANVDVLFTTTSQAVLVRRPPAATIAQTGTIFGVVTDRTSHEPIPGAQVRVDETSLSATSGNGGEYRIAMVPAGTHTVTARRIGYSKATQSVTVGADQEAKADFALEKSAATLDQVVVTGSVIPTEQKVLPSPVTVITSEEIERKNAVKVDQLLRGTAPGVITWDQGPIDYYAQFGSIRGASTFSFNAFKVYIDGVETSTPNNINTIDPESIDHIEIVRGPQASTLYGSQALAGVMQIFTKKGYAGTRPTLNGKIAIGAISSKWVKDTPFSQDYSLGVSGGQPAFSYNLGGTYYHVDPYIPEAKTSNSSAYGSLHGTQDKLTMDLSGRYYAKDFNWPLNPILRDAGYTSFSKPQNQHNSLTQQTYGLNLGYTATQTWQHNLTLGYDQNVSNQYNGAPRHTTPADTFMTVSYGSPSKVSAAYNTSAKFQLGPAVTSTLTAGADHWHVNDGGYTVIQSRNNDGTLQPRTGGPMALYRMQYSNTGYFTQVVFGFADQLFITGGLRGEQNDNFGKDYGVSWSPRIGGSYVHGFGNTTVKARASYGKATRPPDPTAAEGSTRGNTVYLGNTQLAPEQQVGSEAGLDFYFGNRVSLQTTYYNQTAIDLIDLVHFPPIDSTKIYYKWENVGRIKNKGWEFQGNLDLSPVTLHLTYSITDSRVRTLSPSYTGDLRPGDKMLEVPYNSGGATITYTLPKRMRTDIQFGATYIGHQTNTDYLALYGLYYGGQPYRGSTRAYWMEYPTVTKYNLSVNHEFSDKVSGFIQADNLTGNLAAERDNSLAQRGLWTTVGLRFTR